MLEYWRADAKQEGKKKRGGRGKLLTAKKIKSVFSKSCLSRGTTSFGKEEKKKKRAGKRGGGSGHRRSVHPGTAACYLRRKRLREKKRKKKGTIKRGRENGYGK